MKNVLLSIFALLLVFSCQKKEQDSSNSTEVISSNSKEVSLEQEPKIFKNSKGEELTVTYFAEGNQVAVKIQKTGDVEQKLSAKTSNAAGNPIFTNDECMWEMTEDGSSGKLSDKDGNSMEYK